MHFVDDIKDINRLREIVLVFFEEGFGHYILNSKLKEHLPFRKKFQKVCSLTNKEELALHLRHAFEKLGPTFVKLGQLLSLRPDLVPVEFCKELEKLQDHVPPFPFEEAKAIIEEDLKKPLCLIFSSFNREPVASASIAQVHQATLLNGQKVAVKVQRPNIKKVIDADLDILFHLAHSLELHFPETRNFKPMEVVKEFAYWTRRELNFQIEAQSAQRLKEELKNNSRVLVPKVYPEYSSRRVMVQDYVDGFKLDDLSKIKHYHLSRSKLVMAYFTSLLEQSLMHGFFHADPHPANIFVNKKGKLIYLDYGIMGYLPDDDRHKIVQFIASIPEKDSEKSLNIIISLARDASHADIVQFKQDALPILGEVYTSTIGEKSVGSALYEILSTGARNNVIFDPNHLLVAKAFYQGEGIAVKLNPKFKVTEGFYVFAKQYLQKKYSPLKVLKETAGSFWKHRDLLLELPDHIAKIVERMEAPEPQHNLEIKQLEELENEFEDVNKRRNIGMIISALIIASAVLFYVERRTHLWGMPLSLIMFITALILMIFLFFFNHKKRGVW